MVSVVGEKIVERAKGIEPSTSNLEGSRSTAELHPHSMEKAPPVDQEATRLRASVPIMRLTSVRPFGLPCLAPFPRPDI